MVRLADVRDRIEHLEMQATRREHQHISINGMRSDIYESAETRIYVPTATGALAHRDDDFVRVVMGPYGSGKSTWAINEIVRRACAMPTWYNGRRRSRWGIVRNTSGELQSTTLQTWLNWFSGLGDISRRQKPILTYNHIFRDQFGTVELELLFIALDRPDDVRRIKSLELTGCYINELSEVPKAALSHMKGRVNRYPSHSFCHEPYFAGVIADTNPPDEDHWIYNDFELQKHEGYKLYKQPPGLIKNKDDKWMRNEHADNAQNLAKNYYENLAVGQTEEFIKVFCLGQYGTVGTGKRVYPEFNTDLHAVDEIAAIQGEPIHLGWDGGLTPACIVVQLSERGQFRILKEYVGEDIGIRAFGEFVLQRLKVDFPYNKVGISVFDPSGANRDQIMEDTSCIAELTSIGIKTEKARTNDLAPRLGAVRYFLNRMVDGNPAAIISRKGCPQTYKGFAKDYVFKRLAVSGEERYRDVPDKNKSSHPHDAVQYIAMEFAGNEIAKEKVEQKPIDMFNPIARVMM